MEKPKGKRGRMARWESFGLDPKKGEKEKKPEGGKIGVPLAFYKLKEAGKLPKEVRTEAQFQAYVAFQGYKVEGEGKGRTMTLNDYLDIAKGRLRRIEELLPRSGTRAKYQTDYIPRKRSK